MSQTDWIPCAIGQLAAPIRNALVGGPFGSNLVSKDYVPSGIPVIRGQNLTERWVGGEFVFVTDEKANQLAANTARPGDIVFTQRGTLGQVAIVPDSPFDYYVISQSQMKLTVDPTKADHLFLYYFFQSPEHNEYLARHTIQTGVPHTNLGVLRNTPLSLPPLPIQRRIADILGALDDKIEVNRRIAATLEAMAQALFQHWFVDFGPFQGGPFVETELGMVPEGWEVRTLPDAIEVNPKRKLSKGGIVPYLEMSNMPTRSAQALDWYDRPYTSGSKFQNGDVLVAKITPCLENGKTAFVDFLDNKAVGWGSTEYIVLRSRPPWPPEFAYYLARSDEFRSYLIRHMSGTSGRQRVPDSCLSSYPLVIPAASSDVADRFNQAVSPMMAHMKRLADESRALAATRDYLLPKLLSGEVAVDAGEEIPAGAGEAVA